jgi:hypothetical protein
MNVNVTNNQAAVEAIKAGTLDGEIYKDGEVWANGQAYNRWLYQTQQPAHERAAQTEGPHDS